MSNHHRSVNRLLSRYGSLIDSGEFHAWSRLFAVHGRMVLMDGTVVVGHDSLEQFAESAPRGTHVTGIADVVGPTAANPNLQSTTSWIFHNRDTGTVISGIYCDIVLSGPPDEGALFLERTVHIFAPAATRKVQR